MSDENIGSTPGFQVPVANWYGESILPVIALRKWTESYFWDGTGGSETIGAAKHAAMEKLRMIAWKFCRG